jgi:hypothetical protein
MVTKKTNLLATIIHRSSSEIDSNAMDQHVYCLRYNFTERLWYRMDDSEEKSTRLDEEDFEFMK